MKRTFLPVEGANCVTFAARGQDDLVVVPAEGLEVETEAEVTYDKNVYDEETHEFVETVSVTETVPANVDLIMALEAHESVREGHVQPSLGDPED